MAIDSDLIRGHVDTIILKTLASGDKYGYEIIKEIEAKSNGTYELKQPTLYSCLKRLESQGFISAYWVNSDIGGKRHYYKLTDLGRSEYDNNMREWLSSRSIIDNLIAENADDVLPEVTTNFVPLTGTENITFKKKTEEEQESETQTDSSPTQGEPLNPENSFDDNKIETNEDITENISTNNEEPESSAFVNPFAEFYGIENNDDVSLETSEQDLKLVEEYYNTDENQIDIFTSFENTNVEETATLDSDEHTIEEVDNPNEIDENETILVSGENSENKQNDIDDVIIRNEDNFSSTKFNFKDYKLNNDNYFSQVKNEVGGSGFFEDTAELENYENVLAGDETSNSTIFDEIIKNEQLNDYNELFENDEDFNDDVSINALEENDGSFEISRRFEDFDSTSIDEDDSLIDETLNSYDEDDDNEDAPEKLNFGFDEDSEDDVSGKLVFGTEENEDDEPLPFVRFNYGFNNEDDDHVSDAEQEIEQYSSQNFTIHNQENISSSYKYDYDEETLSESRDISIREEYSPPVEDEKNEVVVVEPELVQDPNTPVAIFSDPNATANLFVDNKRSFVPQYTDNDSRQLLNTLSSYGSIRFSPTTKSTHTPKHIASSLDDLRTDFNNAGIEVRVYERRPKETTETKNYILANKIKFTTSWIAYLATSLLLVVGYLIAGLIGYTDLQYVPTAMPASFYLFMCLGIMLVIPGAFTTIYLLNQTKKLKQKYSAKVAIIFALLFAVQCLVIIYVVNIPFGLYSFTQFDYNHLLWYLPAICTLYIPVHTLVYTILFNSKKFHV